jgi:hypothetical protein
MCDTSQQFVNDRSDDNRKNAIIAFNNFQKVYNNTNGMSSLDDTNYALKQTQRKEINSYEFKTDKYSKISPNIQNFNLNNETIDKKIFYLVRINEVFCHILNMNLQEVNTFKIKGTSRMKLKKPSIYQIKIKIIKSYENVCIIPNDPILKFKNIFNVIEAANCILTEKSKVSNSETNVQNHEILNISVDNLKKLQEIKFNDNYIPDLKKTLSSNEHAFNIKEISTFVYEELCPLLREIIDEAKQSTI